MDHKKIAGKFRASLSKANPVPIIFWDGEYKDIMEISEQLGVSSTSIGMEEHVDHSAKVMYHGLAKNESIARMLSGGIPKDKLVVFSMTKTARLKLDESVEQFLNSCIHVKE